MNLLRIAVAILAATAVTRAYAADRVEAAVACKPTSVWLAYDCIIKLSNAATGAPLQKAQLTVTADIPTKPLADKVAPVVAKATATPGEYRAIVVLDVHGDWALRMRVAGPLKDQVDAMLNFGPQAVGPARNPTPPPPDPVPKAGRKPSR